MWYVVLKKQTGRETESQRCLDSCRSDRSELSLLNVVQVQTLQKTVMKHERTE